MSNVILGSMLRSLAVIGFIAISSSASGAAAEQATLQVRNGAKYSGELLEYVPGDHVVLGTGPGKTLRFATSDLVSFDIAAAPAARPAAKPVPAAVAAPAHKASKEPSKPAAASGGTATGPSDLVRAAAVQALLTERADWQARDTNLAAPVLFTLVGVIATGVGIGLQVAYQNSDRELSPHPSDQPAMHRKNDELNAASLMTFVTGGVLLGSGFALWIRRTSEARRTRELERIDAQLESYGVEAAVSPWVSPSGGLSGGLNLHVTM